jgi:thymidylate kinase
VNELLLRSFSELDAKRVVYCLMRDYEQLDQIQDDRDIDVLVDQRQLAETCCVLRGLGFLRIPARGHAPHHFFVAYHEESDLWIELDVVTEVCCGRPIYALRTGLAEGCLRNRRRRDPTFVPSAEDELVMLLLHCVLDKGCVTSPRRERLTRLVDEVNREQYVTGLLAACWSPEMTWTKLSARIRGGDWDALLGERTAVARHLARRDRLGTIHRKVRDRVLRQFDRVSRVLRPRSLSVTLLAPDGAGKTTLARGIQDTFRYPARSIYMGPYRTGRGPAGRHVPVLGLLGRMSRQWWRYLTGRYHRTRGRLVIFDRYGYDALAPPEPYRTRLGRAHAWLMSHACPAPDLVLVLDAPSEVLHARKGESTAPLLENQRRGYLELQRRFPRAILVDATPDAQRVRRRVTSLIWHGHEPIFQRSRTTR